MARFSIFDISKIKPLDICCLWGYDHVLCKRIILLHLGKWQMMGWGKWMFIKHMYAYRIGFRVIMIYLLHLAIDVIKYSNLIHPFLNIFHLLSELGTVSMPPKWRPRRIIKHAFMSIKIVKPCHINRLANNKIKFLKKKHIQSSPHRNYRYIHSPPLII